LQNQTEKDNRMIVAAPKREFTMRNTSCIEHETNLRLFLHMKGPDFDMSVSYDKEYNAKRKATFVLWPRIHVGKRILVKWEPGLYWFFTDHPVPTPIMTTTGYRLLYDSKLNVAYYW